MPRQSSRNAKKPATDTTTAKTRITKRKVVESVSETEEPASEEPKTRTTKRNIVESEAEEPANEEPKATKKRKTAAKGKADDTMPLAERTAIASLKKSMYIGAHVSSAGGVQNSITNAVQIGANAFALFLKSQRKWANPPIKPEARDGFRALSREHEFEVHRHCLPHGSYLVNLAAAEKDKADQAYGAFIDDLQRCEQLGVKLYNFHPGNTNGDTKANAVQRIAKQLNKSHRATSTVVTVLENMAGQGNVVGATFEDLRDIIALVDDKDRVGVCIDTCHAFAAGYDLRAPESFAETMSMFDDVVGGKYLKAFHLNDSKAPFRSHRDLHANIGTGFLGLRAFHNLMNHKGNVNISFEGLPMILETPIDRKDASTGKTVEDKQIWANEIKLLESLIGMDPEGDEFKALDARLQAQGAGERAKIQDQVDRKGAKDAKKTTKATKAASAGVKKSGGRTTKKAETSDEEEDSE